jgi:hypothetical protein
MTYNALKSTWLEEDNAMAETVIWWIIAIMACVSFVGFVILAGRSKTGSKESDLASVYLAASLLLSFLLWAIRH